MHLRKRNVFDINIHPEYNIVSIIYIYIHMHIHNSYIHTYTYIHIYIYMYIFTYGIVLLDCYKAPF